MSAMNILAVMSLFLVLDSQIVASLTCFNCDGHGHPFPACLAAPITCHPGEVCSVVYGSGQPVMKCMKELDCSRIVSNSLGACAGGGVKIQHDRCELCCHTSDCVDDVVLHIQQTIDPGLYCPGPCSRFDLSTCTTSGTQCLAGQFCRVTVNDHYVIHGQCLNIHEHQKCIEDQAKHPCLNVDGHGGNCVLDCCQTASCFEQHFGTNTNNAVATGPSCPGTCFTEDG
ncbi:unnamed protein product, partial [Lymnaea stagnalis]